MTQDTWWGVKILSIFHLTSSHGNDVLKIGRKRMTSNYKGVFRTAPATMCLFTRTSAETFASLPEVTLSIAIF